ncbi:MAG: HAMP domain-containing protein [Elusimicrobia bacterium]|nr:HAMP domain-containing protein [Elusimicrobiota bacterium]MBD3411881.1 HAMP domain-containing protein [Elusimicrobiota bacterium]
MKLKTRFSILTGLLVIIIVGSFSIIFFFYQKQTLSTEIKQRQLAVAENFFTVCQDAVIRNDDILILNYMKGMKRTQPGVRYAFVMEPTGLILTLYESQLFAVPGTSIFQEHRDAELLTRNLTDRNGDEIIEISKPIRVRNEAIAFSFIGFSNTFYESLFLANQKQLLKRIGIIFLIVLVLGLAGSFFLAGKMIKPVHGIIQAIRQIGTGNLDQKVEKGDTSELGELARAFNRMAVNLRELDDMKKHFIASVSHELRSPLNAIEGHIDFLVEELYTGIDRERIIDILSTIKKNSTRLSGFINNILDLSTIESGKLELDTERLNIVNFADEVVELFGPLAREKKIHLENTISYDQPLSATVDRARMRQVFNNLVGNALKFTPAGGTITIEARVVNDMIAVTVADTGIGIPQENQEAIFDKFMQIRAHREDVGNVKGTGLGLTIVKGIVEAHGGSIRVQSRPGKGSKFIFTVPRAKEKNPA